MRKFFRPSVVFCAVALGCTAQSYVVGTVAGSYPLGDGGPARNALLWTPATVVVDGSGGILVADFDHNRVRKIAPDGVITSLAGNGRPGFNGDGGPAVSSELNGPSGLALDQDGNLYIADMFNYRIRRIGRDGKITTVAGDGTAGYSGDGQKATAARLRKPEGLGMDKAGNLYIADTGNHCLRKVTRDGNITTVAGTGVAGFSGDSQAATEARLFWPAGAIVFDTAGNLYFSDTWNFRVRRITPEGVISTVAGCYESCIIGGTATRTFIGLPDGLAFDAVGNLLIVDWGFDHVWRMVLGGGLQRLAGTGDYGFAEDGGAPDKAMLAGPRGVAVDAAGTIYFCEADSNRLRKIAGGALSTVAGRSHYSGDNGPATDAVLFGPTAVAYDKNGNLYIADTWNNRVRKVTPSGTMTTVAGSSDIGGYAGDGGPATSARLDGPRGVAVDAEGNVYIADSSNHRIRKVTLDGKIGPYAGTGRGQSGGDTGPAKDASLNFPSGLALDKNGNLFVADTDNHRVRKISSQGIITAVAGLTQAGFSGDGGLATGAMLSSPVAVAVDAQGAVYIADTGNDRIRKVDPSGIINTVVQYGSAEGVAVDAAGNLFFSATYSNRIQRLTPANLMTTIAGTGEYGFSGDGGFATAALLGIPTGIALDSLGNLAFADRMNHRVRKLSAVVPAQLLVVSGNGQSGGINQQLSSPLVVKVVTATGLGLPGVTVTFTISSGQGKLSAASSTTGPDGTAGVTLTLGPTAGTVTVTAAVVGLTDVRFTATAVRQPRINSVRGAAGASEALAPGGVAVISGLDLATGGDTSPTVGDLQDGRLPTRYRGTCVQFGGEPVPIVSLGSTQANVQVPPGTADGEIAVQVIVGCGDADETKSNVVTVLLQSAAPEFFLLRRDADGRGPITATRGSTPIGPSWLGSGYVPAQPGDTITLTCSGLGATDPPLERGIAPTGLAPISGMASLAIGELVVPASNITYIGAAPGLFGVYQVEVKLPDDVADGDQTVVLTVNGFASPLTGYLTIQR